MIVVNSWKTIFLPSIDVYRPWTICFTDEPIRPEENPLLLQESTLRLQGVEAQGDDAKQSFLSIVDTQSLQQV